MQERTQSKSGHQNSAACNNEPKLLSLGMHEQEVPSATRDSGGTRYSDTDTG